MGKVLRLCTVLKILKDKYVSNLKHYTAKNMDRNLLWDSTVAITNVLNVQLSII